MQNNLERRGKTQVCGKNSPLPRRSLDSTDNLDYHAQVPDGDDDQLPAHDSCVIRGSGIRHSCGTELLFVPFESSRPRHLDLAGALWALLVITSAGRGEDSDPAASYSIGKPDHDA